MSAQADAFREEPNLRGFRRILIGQHVVEPPSPWEFKSSFPAGNLQAIGFVDTREKLIAFCKHETIIVECDSAVQEAVISRLPPRGFDWRHSTQNNLCQQEVSQCFYLAGPHGGGLLRQTPDGWRIEQVILPWPRTLLFLIRPSYSLSSSNGCYKIFADERRFDTILDEGYPNVIAGFSSSGRTLLFYNNSQVTVLGRRCEA